MNLADLAFDPAFLSLPQNEKTARVLSVARQDQMFQDAKPAEKAKTIRALISQDSFPEHKMLGERITDAAGSAMDRVSQFGSQLMNTMTPSDAGATPPPVVEPPPPMTRQSLRKTTPKDLPRLLSLLQEGQPGVDWQAHVLPTLAAWVGPQDAPVMSRILMATNSDVPRAIKTFISFQERRQQARLAKTDSFSQAESDQQMGVEIEPEYYMDRSTERQKRTTPPYMPTVKPKGEVPDAGMGKYPRRKYHELKKNKGRAA